MLADRLAAEWRKRLGDTRIDELSPTQLAAFMRAIKKQEGGAVGHVDHIAAPGPVTLGLPG
jgi:hypothetical protein